jgi:hypothetical protein
MNIISRLRPWLKDLVSNQEDDDNRGISIEEFQEKGVESPNTGSSGSSVMSVDDAVKVLEELGGQTSTPEMLDKAREIVSPEVKKQTISQCIDIGRKKGLLDYDTEVEPTKVWTAERER